MYYKVVLQFSGSSGPLILLFPKKLIIWLSNLSNLRVPDEGYSRDAPCALNLISAFFIFNTRKTNCISMLSSKSIDIVVKQCRELN